MPAFKMWAIEAGDCKPWWDEWNELDETKSEEEQVAAADALLAQVADAAIDPATVGALPGAADRLFVQTFEPYGMITRPTIAAAVAIELENVEEAGRAHPLPATSRGTGWSCFPKSWRTERTPRSSGTIR